MKIAIVGKGGSGKTTLAATLARLFARRGFSVLAIDGDPSPNLGVALGVEAPKLTSLHPLPESIIKRRTDASGESQVVGLAESIESITTEYGVLAPDGVKLLMNVRLDHAGEGCLCAEHGTMRDLVGHLVEQPQQLTIVDMEASVEHMGRGTPRYADVLLIVTEPYYRSLVLPLVVVDNSLSQLRTHVGLIFSSSECRKGYIILRSPRLDQFSPSSSLLLLFHRASSHVIHAHMRTHGTGGKGEQSTSRAVHRRLGLPAAIAGVGCR